jgi:large subunit ribosomal protein L32
MPVPKKKLSATRSGNRRSHLALASTQVTMCPNCKKPLQPHTVCLSCGMYAGKQVLPKK